MKISRKAIEDLDFMLYNIDKQICSMFMYFYTEIKQGNATITYPDGSKDVIPADKLITEKPSDNGGDNSHGGLPFILGAGASEDDNEKDDNKTGEKEEDKRTDAEAEERSKATDEKFYEYGTHKQLVSFLYIIIKFLNSYKMVYYR